MGCCGPDVEVVLPPNEKQPGDILVEANWAGNRPFVGPATGRHYGVRVGNFRPIWIAKEDVDATPHYWRKPSQQETQRIVMQPQYVAQAPEMDWKQTADVLFGGGPTPQVPSKPVEYNPNTAGLKKADVLAKVKGDGK